MNRQEGIHSFNQRNKLQLTAVRKEERNSKTDRQRETDREGGRESEEDRMYFSKIPSGCPQFDSMRFVIP